MNRLPVSLIILVTMFFYFGFQNSSVHAQDVQACIKQKLEQMKDLQDFTSEQKGCESARTNWKGERQACHTTGCYTAPTGYVVEAGSATITDVSVAGSRNSVGDLYFKDFDATGYPRTACADCGAWSHSGANAGPGHAYFKIKGKFFKPLTDQSIIEATIGCVKK